MPKKTLERNKNGGWTSTKEALPSEIEQKKVATKPSANNIKASQDSATKPKAKVK